MEAEYFSTFSVAVAQKRSRTEGVKPQTCYPLAQSPALGNTGILNLHLPGDSCPPPQSLLYPLTQSSLGHRVSPAKSPSSMHPLASSPQPSPRLLSLLPVPLSPNWLLNCSSSHSAFTQQPGTNQMVRILLVKAFNREGLVVQ